MKHLITSPRFPAQILPIFLNHYRPIIQKPNPKLPISSNRSLATISVFPSSLPAPRKPLFLRPLVYSSTVSDLRAFVEWGKALASSVGSSFVRVDNGLDSELLIRELRWLLEDSVDDPSIISCIDIVGVNRLDGVSRVVRLRESLDRLYELWKERIEERRPFQYIVGCEHWRDLVLSVEEGVLIPRPETEKIVELVEIVVAESEMLREGVWADLGTGSGALAIGITRSLGGNGRVVATDLSPTAVSVAKVNVERYGLEDVVEIRRGSWFDPMLELEGELAGLVSNPPYIPSEDLGGLQAEVGKHEPRLALDGGAEGMDSLLYLCKQAAKMLKPGGFFAFETNGEKQCKSLANYLENESARNFRDVNIVPDFADIPRFLTGFRSRSSILLL